MFGVASGAGCRRAVHHAGSDGGTAARGIKADRSAVEVSPHAKGPSFKKTVLPAERSRPSIARIRERWKAHQGKVDRRRLVFIDETWIKT